MNRSYRLARAVLLLLMVNIVTLGVSMRAAQSEDPERLAFHSVTGRVRFIGASVTSPITIEGAEAKELSSAARAEKALQVYAPHFGVRSEDLTFSRDISTRDGIVSRRYQQRHKGIPVFGAELIVNMTANGEMVSMLGEASPDLVVSTIPTMTAVQAEAQALYYAQQVFQVDRVTLSTAAPSLSIYDARLVEETNEDAKLVWQVEIVSLVGAPIKAIVLVDASSGDIRLFYNQIDAHPVSNSILESYQINLTQPLAIPHSSPVRQIGLPGTANLATYDANNGQVLPGTLVCDETQQPCTSGLSFDEALNSIHRFSKETYDLYYNWHGRNSYDNAGIEIISSAHLGSPNYCNAFWNGQQTAYGDGCGGVWRDDVVAHEMTHAVTQYTSGLIYRGESGAINESLSDIWGEFYDLTNATSEDIPENRWRIGENLNFGFPQSGIRDMKDPTLFSHPDKMTSPHFYVGNGDQGGVHINSGVNNKAAYLLTDGGTFNGVTVAPIGMMKTAALYYDVQTTKLTSSSNYADLADALEQSCTELIGGVEGFTASDCMSVQNAVLATEMRLTGGPDAKTADICEPGAGSAYYIFSDDLESGNSKWLSSSLTGANNWAIGSTHKPIIGNKSIYGMNGSSTSLSYVAMVNSVRLPSNGFLHFSHTFLFNDEKPRYYDGGIIEYTTNDGATWIQLPSAGFFEEGIDYNGTLVNAGTNPLKGKNAFVGFSGNGVGSTRYNLAPLAGQNVRFRWLIGTDAMYGAIGWRIDNVGIYICSQNEPTPTPSPGIELIANGGFEQDTLTPWTLKNGSRDKLKCNKDTDGDYRADRIFSRSAQCAFMFRGSTGENAKLIQNVNLNVVTPTIGTRIDLSVYVKAASAATSTRIKLRISYSDGTAKGKKTLIVQPGADYIEQITTYTLESSAVRRIKIQIDNKGLSGKVYIDDASLTYKDGTSFGVLPLPAQ